MVSICWFTIIEGRKGINLVCMNLTLIKVSCEEKKNGNIGVKLKVNLKFPHYIPSF